MARRDPFLFIGPLASAALVVAVRAHAPTTARVLLAFLALHALGYAIVHLAWPPGRLSLLERHALSFAAGVLALPLLGLAASETMGFRAENLAWLLHALASLLSLIALLRRHVPEPAARSPMPSTRVTLAIAGGALVLSAAMLAPALAPRSVPPALALLEADGEPARTGWKEGEERLLVLVARSGTQARSAPLLVTWNNATLIANHLTLEAGEVERIVIELPATAAGLPELHARWAGLRVNLHAHVEAAA